MASRWSLPDGDTTAANALHPAQRHFIPRANAERSSFAFDTSLHIAQFTCRAVPPWRLQCGRDIRKWRQNEESLGRRWMRNNERPICIGTFRLSAMWAWMYHCNVLHRNDVDVEATRAEPHRWHATKESLQLFHAHKYFNRSRSWLIGE